MTELTRETEIKTDLEKNLAGIVSNVQIKRARRIFADTDAVNIVKCIAYLKNNLGFTHIPLLFGQDEGENLSANYVADKDGVLLTLRAVMDAKNPEIDTIKELFDGIDCFERELVDMFGIKVKGLLPGNRYPLPDDWPSDQHPLLKSWKQENKNG